MTNVFSVTILIDYLKLVYCAEGVTYDLIKAEYDLSEAEQLNPTEQTDGNFLVFSDIKYDNSEISAVITKINTETRKIEKEDIITEEQVNAFPNKLITIVTDEYAEENETEGISRVFNSAELDEITYDEAIDQINELVERKSHEENDMPLYVLKEVKNTIVELGKECKFTPEKKKEKLEANCEKLPVFIQVKDIDFTENAIYHVYITFIVDGIEKKTEIIKVARDKNSGLKIFDLREYGKKKTTKKVSKKEDSKTPKLLNQEKKQKSTSLKLLICGSVILAVIIFVVVLFITLTSKENKYSQLDESAWNL
ncbi:hypothetical protein ECANGB1_1685 [Enterospora canceri]|uniref:Uncharacterized protein n=1 Tax=Enterospora canceri TaxID=1081671 RepID=A0A1Y1S918_9MICR|nr:hypothetical protein ECANGB1_1685 [Enterospora canceri]